MRRKLYSAKGTYLGVVTYPQKWDDQLQAFGSARVRIESAPRAHDSQGGVATENARTFVLAHAPWEAGAVMLQGITPEQFERLPLCSFEISISYLRTLMP